jgi:signal transduction histidine kinase
VYSSNLPDNLPQLWVDKRALKRVQLNILTNAIKFPSEGGTERAPGDIGDCCGS